MMMNPFGAAGPWMIAVIPVPDRVTVCGEPEALSVTLTLADFAPVLVGVKVTAIAHEFPAARLAGQLFVWENIAAFVPVIPIELIASAAVPLFVRVTDCGEDDVLAI